MTTEEILTLLRDACPELTWKIDGATVHAEETAIVVQGQPPVLGRADYQTATATQLAGMDRWTIRQTVCDLLTQEEIDALPNGALFDARVDLSAANDELELAAARSARSRAELEDAAYALDLAEQRVARAEAVAQRLESAAQRAHVRNNFLDKHACPG